MQTGGFEGGWLTLARFIPVESRSHSDRYGRPEADFVCRAFDKTFERAQAVSRPVHFR